MNTPKTITIVGAGLAGSECALQLAHRNFKVHLIEMRSQTMTPAHKTNLFAELVCSNSFGNLQVTTAPGQLKWEAEKLNSYILKTALDTQVPAGMALGIDREKFSQSITTQINDHPNITVSKNVITDFSQIPRPAVIATGPLTHPHLATNMQKYFGDEFLYFFDAIAPIIDTESINMDIAWKADRYGKGTDDYINCPLNKDQYYTLINAMREAEKVEPKGFEKIPYFEGCMPIEVMVERGPETPRFGPMKPKGLYLPQTGKETYAIVQLRQENKEATAYNMVGFQTKMTYKAQKDVFKLIPGLENADFLKLGSIHRNLYINTPKKLNKDLSCQKDPLLFFAGQITGVEGYFESTCTGLLVSHFLTQKLNGQNFTPPHRATALGSLLQGITAKERMDHFQPININFGLFPPLKEHIRDKKERRNKQILEAQNSMELSLNIL